MHWSFVFENSSLSFSIWYFAVILKRTYYFIFCVKRVYKSQWVTSLHHTPHLFFFPTLWWLTDKRLNAPVVSKSIISLIYNNFHRMMNSELRVIISHLLLRYLEQCKWAMKWHSFLSSACPAVMSVSISQYDVSNPDDDGGAGRWNLDIYRTDGWLRMFYKFFHWIGS